jgi:hypothetical protein
MGYSPADTIANLRARGVVVDDAAAADFADFWMSRFWSAPMFATDDAMPETLFWAQEAARVGAEVVFLTGRSAKLPDGSPSGFEQASVDQLVKAGLSWVTLADVIVKPTVDTDTVEFKIQHLQRLREDAYIGWFLTEGSRHVAAVEQWDPRTNCVLLENSFDRDRDQVPAHVPTLDQVW